MITELQELNVSCRQSPTSGGAEKVSRKFPVSLNRANIGVNPGVFVELMRIELMASRVRFWRCGKEVKELASKKVSRYSINRRNHSVKTWKLGKGRN